MALLPVHNPIVPFVGHIPGGLLVGLRLTIKGMMTYSSPRFTIDFQNTPETKKCNIALHLSVRPSERVIVRNHFHDGKWGCEERIGGCPIQPGDSYQIDIVVTKGCYSIHINGNHFTEFYHRLPMECFSCLVIKGATKLEMVRKETMMERPTSLLAPVATAHQNRNVKTKFSSLPPGLHEPPPPYSRSLPYDPDSFPQYPPRQPENGPYHKKKGQGNN